jgi:hypothetical protein
MQGESLKGEDAMDDISRVSRVEFVLGRGQTAILPRDRKNRKAGKAGKAKSREAKTTEDEFHLHTDPVEESAVSLDSDHVDLDV